MTKADYLKALIRTHSEGDDERFYAVALQVAAQEAQHGHTKFAQELRELVDQARARRKTFPAAQHTRPVALIQPRGELAGLLTATYPKTRLVDMAVDEAVHRRIERVLLEQRNRTALREYGFAPLRKLLLIGPPGTGKTMTAAVLAGELGLPLLTIQLDGLITKYLGETAAKLRLIFDAIRETRAVYLFDEFDALGGERAARNEVGEIRRVLNSFLQFLELDESESLIVAATNHPQLLDRALFRRFDSVIEYPLPSQGVAEKVMRARLAPLDTTGVDWPKVAQASKGLSHADITRACEHAAKNAILEHRRYVDTADVLDALDERRKAHTSGR
ncbi:MAG: AAA family ATPase [Anaerolineae bacterium]